MNIQLDLRMGKSEFLTWVQAHEGRYELAGSCVVSMMKLRMDRQKTFVAW